MPRQGHRLTIATIGNDLVATCQCDQWRRTLRLPDGADVINLVGILTGKHDRHLERLGRQSAMGGSGEGPLVPPDEPSKS